MADVKSTSSFDVQEQMLKAMGIENVPLEQQQAQPQPEPVVDPETGGDEPSTLPSEPVDGATEGSPEQNIEEPTGVVDEPSTEPKPEGEGKEEAPVEDGSSEGDSSGVIIDDDGKIDSWDEVVEAKEDENLNQIDYQALGKELGFEVTSTEDIKTKLQELTAQNEELSSVQDNFVNLPDQLKSVIEYANNGGDWQAYLQVESADYSKVNPSDLFAADAANIFRDEQGQVDQERYEAYLDSFTPEQQHAQGIKLQGQYMREQELRKKELQMDLEKRQAQEDQRLKEALNNFNEVADFKINTEHKQKLYNDLTNGQALNRLFYDANGNYDYNKIVKTIFIADKFDKMIDVARNRARTEKTREVINDLSNNTVTKPKAEPVNPKVDDRPAEEKNFDLFLQHAMQQGNSNNPMKAFFESQQNK